MHRTLVRISPLSAAKIFGTMYLVIGLLFVPFFLLPMLFAAEAAESPVGFGFALFLPIFYALMGFVGTAAACWFYNLIAARLGGVELELSDEG